MVKTGVFPAWSRGVGIELIFRQGIPTPFGLDEWLLIGVSDYLRISIDDVIVDFRIIIS
jgi:hypothetical protein